MWEGEHAPAADAAGGIPLPAAQNHKRDARLLSPGIGRVRDTSRAEPVW